MTRYIELPNLDDLLRRYVAGESENKLASEAGVNRWTFRRRLLAANITPRGRVEAETLKWSRMSPEQRAAQTAAAHAATRGRTVDFAEQCRNALGKQRAMSHVAPVENVLAQSLRAYGLVVTQQKAVGPYNLDLALDEAALAVEVCGGNWHGYGRHRTRFFERSEYLFNHGWNLLNVWVDGRRYPLGSGCTQYIVAFVEQLRLYPTSPRKYRVLLGNGQFAPIRKTYLNTPSDIERLGCRLDAAGCYHYVAG